MVHTVRWIRRSFFSTPSCSSLPLSFESLPLSEPELNSNQTLVNSSFQTDTLVRIVESSGPPIEEDRGPASCELCSFSRGTGLVVLSRAKSGR